jgi:FdhD protein
MAAMNLNCAINEKEKLTWRGGVPVPSTRVVAEEKAVALTYCGSTYAVMMATPERALS